VTTNARIPYSYTMTMFDYRLVSRFVLASGLLVALTLLHVRQFYYRNNGNAHATTAGTVVGITTSGSEKNQRLGPPLSSVEMNDNRSTNYEQPNIRIPRIRFVVNDNDDDRDNDDDLDGGIGVVRAEETQKRQSQNEPVEDGDGIPAMSLLPLPLNLMRIGIPIRTRYDDELPLHNGTSSNRNGSPTPTNNNTTACSCSNPESTFECCERFVHTAHKMGVTVIHNRVLKGKHYNSKHKVQRTTPRRNADPTMGGRDLGNLTQLPPHVDHRDVLVLRNIYDSIVSGYLVSAKATSSKSR